MKSTGSDGCPKIWSTIIGLLVADLKFNMNILNTLNTLVHDIY
jgi:hypothetical protein